MNFRDLLNQAFKLPPLLWETTPVPLAASSPFDAYGLLNRMKYLAPSYLIVSHGLRAAKTSNITQNSKPLHKIARSLSNKINIKQHNLSSKHFILPHGMKFPLPKTNFNLMVTIKASFNINNQNLNQFLF